MVARDEITTTVEELLKLISMKNVVGEPMTFGDKTVIMLAKMGVGFGAGTGEAKSEKGEGGTGAGAGGAAGVTPIAIVIVDKAVPGLNGVSVHSLAGSGGVLGKTLGEIASSIAEKIGSRKAEEKVKGEKGEKKVA
jgi:uncharacterized spore protein YtfJ